MNSNTGPDLRGVPAEDVRALFLCGASRTYGEINVVLPLAESVVAAGGEVWFLSSPLAAQLGRPAFADRVFEMSEDRAANQVLFWRIIKKYRPNLVVFSELYEILQSDRPRECPLLDSVLLQDLESVEATLVFMDFIAHVGALQEVLACEHCAGQWGRRALRSFLRRLWVILPCPLHEPGPVPGRRGIPFRIGPSPSSETAGVTDRTRCRAKYLGKAAERDGVLILRGSSTWQADLAEEAGVQLHEYLSDLLALYFEDFPRPVTLVSVSDRHKLRRPEGNSRLKVVNLPNLPRDEYRTLVLAADLVLTENEISYSLGQALGHGHGVLFVNSFTSRELSRREIDHEGLRRLLSKVEENWPGSIFPHVIHPIRLTKADHKLSEAPVSASGGSLPVATTRLGRMASSPFVKIELYGGRQTREILHRLLLDSSAAQELVREETGYLERLQRAESGVGVLAQICAVGRLASHTAL